jgi:prepilin peptidase CpaA
MLRGYGVSMLDDPFKYGLLAALAIALLVAAFTDLRSRQIGNWLNGGIALAAPLFWWACGLSLWPDVAMQVGVALGTFAVLAILFALRAMGGGDVKLLTALALWIEPLLFVNLLVMMALLGGVLTIGFAAWHLMRRQRERLAIPYGVAIAMAGLWVIGTGYLPAVTAAGGLQ